jgi:hypothetical protein
MLPLLLGQTPAAQRSGSAGIRRTEGRSWSPPRTPDGRPDLSGRWNQRTVTPLERDPALGSKEFWTDEEFAAISARLRQGEPLAQAVGEVTSRGRRGGRGGRGDADADAQPGPGGARGNAVRVQYDPELYGFDPTKNTIVSTKRTSLIVGPTGVIPPMVPEAVKRNAERAARNKGHENDSYENRGLQERCIISGLQEIPKLSNADNNSLLQIVQGPAHVAIYQELSHDMRVIPTDGRPHLPRHIRQLQGDSVAHWEDDTLVIDTTNFTDRTARFGSSEQLHLVERFTRIAEDTLMYRFTVEDPATWATPWTAETVWKKTDEQLYEYACHEGNNALRLILGAARKAEAEAGQTPR